MATPVPPAPTAGARAPAYITLVALGALIGVPAALVAVLFLAAVHWSEHLLWTELPTLLGRSEPPWYLIIGLPVAGALIVATSRRLLPGGGGHSPLEGISTDPTPLRYAPGVALAAFGSLAFGAVVGPEAPLIALGSAVGMVVVAVAKVPTPASATLANAGSFSAISALFGGPLVAGMLLLEAGLAAGAALLPALLPGLVAAAVGYVLFVGFGDFAGLPTAGLAVPDLPAYTGLHAGDLALAIVVGVVVSVFVRGVLHVGRLIDSQARLRSPFVALLAGGLAIGLLAQAAGWLGADPHEVLFSGQSAIPSLLAESSAVMVVVILAAKAIAYAVCLGCGFRGGPVFPAIFLGVGVAAVVCLVTDASITWALAVGAAAGMVSATGLVFSALIFSALLTGGAGQDALPAAVLAVVAAWLTTTWLQRREQAPTAPVDAVSQDRAG